MSQRPLRADCIPYPSFQLGDFRKAAILFPVPDWLPVGLNPECAAGARLQGDFVQFITEGGEQLLRIPAATQQPVAWGSPA